MSHNHLTAKLLVLKCCMLPEMSLLSSATKDHAKSLTTSLSEMLFHTTESNLTYILLNSWFLTVLHPSMIAKCHYSQKWEARNDVKSILLFLFWTYFFISWESLTTRKVNISGQTVLILLLEAFLFCAND